jgi:hypothetical protein
MRLGSADPWRRDVTPRTVFTTGEPEKAAATLGVERLLARPAVAPLLLIALDIVLVAALCALILSRTQRSPVSALAPD